VRVFVSGHGFSRAVQSALLIRALAPEPFQRLKPLLAYLLSARLKACPDTQLAGSQTQSYERRAGGEWTLLLDSVGLQSCSLSALS
jgi:hypothetical protein